MVRECYESMLCMIYYFNTFHYLIFFSLKVKTNKNQTVQNIEMSLIVKTYLIKGVFLFLFLQAL